MLLPSCTQVIKICYIACYLIIIENINVNRSKLILLLLFIITMTIIPFLINEDKIIVAQPGVIIIDPENITNQTLQDRPTEDRNMSIDLEGFTNK